jgi:hypothetical protein
MDTNHLNIYNTFGIGLAGIPTFLKFLLFPVRFTKCLGGRVPFRPPRKKKALPLLSLRAFVACERVNLTLYYTRFRFRYMVVLSAGRWWSVPALGATCWVPKP